MIRRLIATTGCASALLMAPVLAGTANAEAAKPACLESVHTIFDPLCEAKLDFKEQLLLAKLEAVRDLQGQGKDIEYDDADEYLDVDEGSQTVVVKPDKAEELQVDPATTWDIRVESAQ